MGEHSKQNQVCEYLGTQSFEAYIENVFLMLNMHDSEQACILKFLNFETTNLNVYFTVWMFYNHYYLHLTNKYHPYYGVDVL